VSPRQLPVLDVAPPVAGLAGPRRPVAPSDDRVTEYRPEDRTLPTFWVWTLGCQMNRSDSEEMAGRLVAAGCAEARSIEAADLVVINTCAIREAAEAKVIGRQGVLRSLKAERPGMRVVLTGCAVRERDRARLRRRFPAVDLFLRPDEEPELVERLGLASAQASVGLGAGAPATAAEASGTAPEAPAGLAPAIATPATAATTLVKGIPVSAADHLAASRAAAVGQGAVRRASDVAAWLPIIYGCDKTCTYCIVPFSRGPERSRPFDDVVAEARALAAAGYREVTLLGQNVNSYGHDLPAEPRFAHAAEERRAGRRLDRAGRPDLAELIRALDAIRDADGMPALPRLRFVTSHPWDLSDRLVDAMGECPSVCEALHLPVQSGDDAVLRRMGRQYTVEHYLERLARIRATLPGIAMSTDVIVGFCGETDAQHEATLDLLRHVRFDQVFAAAYSPRPGTPATRLADDVPAGAKRERLNRLLAVQEAIGFERNRERISSAASVLVDAAARARTHDHDDGPADEAGERSASPLTLAGEDPFARPLPEGWVRLFGRSRENKLVHLPGRPELVGQIVDAQIVGAGPYSLRGVLA
jgi:tRNA-2-methylthio-N6-dimethylallyladenosine synthase